MSRRCTPSIYRADHRTNSLTFPYGTNVFIVYQVMGSWIQLGNDEVCASIECIRRIFSPHTRKRMVSVERSMACWSRDCTALNLRLYSALKYYTEARILELFMHGLLTDLILGSRRGLSGGKISYLFSCPKWFFRRASPRCCSEAFRS